MLSLALRGVYSLGHDSEGREEEKTVDLENNTHGGRVASRFTLDVITPLATYIAKYAFPYV